MFPLSDSEYLDTQIILLLRNYTLRHVLNGNASEVSSKPMYKSVYSNIIHNSKKLEADKMIINGRIYKNCGIFTQRKYAQERG